eukprot:662598-Prorocentrum_minimum.AAC.1
MHERILIEAEADEPGLLGDVCRNGANQQVGRHYEVHQIKRLEHRNEAEVATQHVLLQIDSSERQPGYLGRYRSGQLVVS